MLTHLSIKNFTIIDECELDFKAGFTIFSGETGAGKSIIIDALSLLSGKPSSEHLIKNNQDFAWVEAIFHLPTVPEALKDYVESDGQLIVQRKINRNKENNAKINGQTVPLKFLKQHLSDCFTVVGQNEHITLLNSGTQLAWLDKYQEENITLKTEFEEAFRQYSQLKELEHTLSNQDTLLYQKIDFLKFQLADIASQKFKYNEEEDLAAVKKRVQNHHKTTQSLHQLQESLDKTLDGLASALKACSTLAALDPVWEPISQRLNSCSESIKDEAEQAAHEQMKHNQESDLSIDDIETRLDTIFKYKTKYHQPDLNHVLKLYETLSSELENLESQVKQKNSIADDLQEAEKNCVALAKKWHDHRQKKAEILEKKITDLLKTLHFFNPVFKISLQFTPEKLSLSGADSISFDISLNPGEPLSPLSKVASGGELSRIMLALRSIFAFQNMAETLIFDEIDTGIGGLTANTIGTHLKTLSETSQVICITHLPQIARLADRHFYVKKTHQKQSTSTDIQALNEMEKKQELQRMLGGEAVLQELILPGT